MDIDRSLRTLPPRDLRRSVTEMAALGAEDLKTKIDKLSVEDEEEEELEEGEIVDEAGVEQVERSLHPLESTWKFWSDSGASKSKSVVWGSTMFPIHSFSTVEDFWGYFDLISLLPRASLFVSLDVLLD